jgi:hypothetical protein
MVEVWLKIDKSRYKIDILDLPTTHRSSRFSRPCPSLVTFHEPGSTVHMTSKYCHQKICNSHRPSIYTQKVILAHSLIFDYMILCFRPCLSHVHHMCTIQNLPAWQHTRWLFSERIRANLDFMHNIAWTLLNPNQIKPSKIWSLNQYVAKSENPYMDLTLQPGYPHNTGLNPCLVNLTRSWKTQ